MIRCVMFDFGNVLVQFDIQKLEDFLRSHMADPDTLTLELLFNLEPISDFDLGKISVTDMFERVKDKLNLKKVEISEFLSRSAETIKPSRKMPIIRRMLRKNGFKTAVVSNTNTHHFNHIQSVHPEVFADFDYLMLSFQHGFKKPDHRMLEVPAKHLEVSPDECFFIDDLVSNINAFNKWSNQPGHGHHYNVSDDKFRPNGRLEEEIRGLVIKMVNLGMLTPDQADEVNKS